ncbi:MAG: lipocalin family protein [Clostridia bacterium]|nr:lipocalin family protein [Clostridia bacterium]
MKKLVSLILVLLLICMAIPTMAEEEITGDWYLKTMKSGDQEYDAASIGYVIVMTLNEDGSATMTMPGQEPIAGTWALDGDKITVTADDAPVDGTVSEGAIVLEQDGMEMVFTREEVSAIALAEVKAAESAEEFYGDWTCVYLEMEGKVMDIAIVEMGIPHVSISENGLEFYDEDDGTLTLVLKMNKLDAPVFAEGKLAVKAAADALNPNFAVDAELLEDGMLKLTVVADNSPMILYFIPAEPAA